MSRKQEVFSKARDVYSYRMTCYEILMGNFHLIVMLKVTMM